MPELALLLGCLTLGLEPAILVSIVDQESARNPIAINVNRWEGAPVQPTTLDEALVAAKLFVESGYTVDVGLAGINSSHLVRLGIPFEAAFDPCTNVALGESIYVEHYRAALDQGLIGDAARQAALSAYNTGSMTRGFGNGYVDAVWSRLDASRQYLARTAGSAVEWTPLSARDESADHNEGSHVVDRAGARNDRDSSIVPWQKRQRQGGEAPAGEGAQGEVVLLDTLTAGAGLAVKSR